MIQKIQKTLLHEVVVKQLVESIRLGEFKKGNKLPCEKKLCELYGVSRVTMRAALKKLSEMEFIETRQGMGSIVLVDSDDPRVSAHFSLSVKSMKSNFESTMQARMLLEPALVYTIAKEAADEDIQALISKSNALETEKTDVSAQVLEDFHLLLGETIHNPMISDFLAQLRALENDALSRTPTLPEQNADFRKNCAAFHHKIITAIADRRADMAYLYMKEHIYYLSEQFSVFFQTND